MKVLIASPSNDVSRQLNSTMVELAPRATYLHASNPDSVMNQLERHKIDLAILDLHVFSLKPAASALLKLACPLRLVSTSLQQQLKEHLNQPRPGLLLTFDGSQIESTVADLPDQLRSAALRNPQHDDSPHHIWGQDEMEDWSRIDARHLLWAVTENRKVKARHISGKTHRLRGRLRELEKQLDTANFLRVHKSYLVNTDHIRHVEKWSSGGLLLTLCGPGKTKIPVSRRYAARFRQLSGLDIGPVDRE